MDSMYLDIALNIIEGQTELLEQSEDIEHAFMSTLHILSNNFSVIINHITLPSRIETNTFFHAFLLFCSLPPIQLLLETEVVLKDTVLLAHPIVIVHHGVLVPRLDHGQLFHLEDGGGGSLNCI